MSKQCEYKGISYDSASAKARYLLKATKLSNAEIAKECGISPACVTIVNGNAKIRPVREYNPENAILRQTFALIRNRAIRQEAEAIANGTAKAHKVKSNKAPKAAKVAPVVDAPVVPEAASVVDAPVVPEAAPVAAVETVASVA
jgi:hypothetical protein